MDERYTAAVWTTTGGRRADFFAAFRGVPDTIKAAMAADSLYTVHEEAAALASRAFRTPRGVAASKHRPAEFRLEKLRACSPPLAPLVEMADREECQPGCDDKFLQALDILVQLEGFVPLRDLRSLASSCYTARMQASAILRAPELSVGAADASWQNAAFVARLPGLLRLRVRGDPLLPVIDVAVVRSKPRMRLRSADGGATISEAGALFLGAIIGGGDHTLRLTDNLSYLSLEDLRKSPEEGPNRFENRQPSRLSSLLCGAVTSVLGPRPPTVSLLRPLPGSAHGRAADALVALGALARNETGWHLDVDPRTFKQLVQKAQLTVCAAVPRGRTLDAARRAAEDDENARVYARLQRLYGSEIDNAWDDFNGMPLAQAPPRSRGSDRSVWDAQRP